VLSAATGELQRTIPLELTTAQKFALPSLRLVGSTILLDVDGPAAFAAPTGAELWRVSAG
jgi:hypothetical protein